MRNLVLVQFHWVDAITQRGRVVTEPGAVATGSYTQLAIDDIADRKTCRIRVEWLDPVATTTPRGLPAREPRSASGSVMSASLATGGLSPGLIANCTITGNFGGVLNSPSLCDLWTLRLHREDVPPRSAIAAPGTGPLQVLY